MSKQDGSGAAGHRRAASTTPPRTILHVDMDAFFASVELLEHPELRGKPVIVGHDSPRSVVTAATYEARRYGVNSAMPMAVALRRCPQAIVLEPHFERYTHYSQQRDGDASTTSPRWSNRSASTRRSSTSRAPAPARHARGEIGDATPRAGASPRRACTARSARPPPSSSPSSRRSAPSPTGCWWCRRRDTLGFLHPLPITALWGVGGKTEEVLGAPRAAHGRRRRRRRRSTMLTTRHRRGRRPKPARTRLGPRSAARDARARGEERRPRGHVRDSTSPTADRSARELLALSDDRSAVRLRAAGVAGAHRRAQAALRRLHDDHPLAHARRADRPRPAHLRGGRAALYDAGRPRAARPVRLIGVRVEQLPGRRRRRLGLWDDDEATGARPSTRSTP